jgi:hypothetical protein
MAKRKKDDGTTCSSAAQSIQPHILYARPRTRELVRALLSEGKPRRKPFQFSMLDGNVFVNLEAPLYLGDMTEYQTPISASIMAQRQALAKPLRKQLEKAREVLKSAKGKEAKEIARRKKAVIEAKLKAATKYLPTEVFDATPEQIAEYIRESTKRKDGSSAWKTVFTREGKRKPEREAEDRSMVKRVSLLTLTSKMGCYSFNLPAGPISHGFQGTCPASRFGFPMLTDREATRRGQSEHFANFDVDKQNWLCSGCYGLKGLYGNPSMLFLMEARKQFIEGQIALDKRSGRDDLVDVMVRSIRMGQVKSITERYFLEQMGLEAEAWAIPDPNYFRWHDVGDAWIPEWQHAIFRICEALSEPYEDKRLGLRLPAVKFWQPTRMWMLKGMLNEAAKTRKVPKNLAVRPSAAHFGQAPPKIKGLAAGAGSVCLSEDVTEGDRKNVEAVLGTKLYDRGGKGWICPAYLRPEFKEGRRVGGGGAIIQRKLMASGEEKEKLVGGACARAYGPDGAMPAPHGPGCRVCWDRPDLIVVYPEH